MARSPRELAGRVAVVTGGARGIGLATARALSAHGARVAVGDLDAAGAAAAAAALGPGALGGGLDVTRRESFEAFLARVREHSGPVDVLVNNAGVLHVGPFLAEDDEWTSRQIDVNLRGVVLGMRLVLGEMCSRGTGHVVNVGSLASRVGVPREAVYSATKHAVAGLSEAVRRELRGTGVEVSLVMPGLVRTQLAAGTLDARGTRVSEPDAVARAVVAVLERPRAEVHVPPRLGALQRALGLLPRGARDTVLRAAGLERFTLGATAQSRAAYEERVTRAAGSRGEGA